MDARVILKEAKVTSEPEALVEFLETLGFAVKRIGLTAVYLGSQDARHHAQELPMRFIRHERERNEKREKRGYDLWNVNQRLLLNLRQGLKERHENSDDGSHHHQRGGHENDGKESVFGRSDYFRARHRESPQDELSSFCLVRNG